MPGILYSRLRRVPVALNVDDLAIEDTYDLKLVREGSVISRIAELIYKVFYLQGDAITPVSSGYVETISQKYGVARDKIYVVRGGVDLQVFKPTASIKKNENRFVVIYSGAFSVAYNFRQILEAAKILESHNYGAEFIIQGKGELAGDIKSEISRLKLKNVKLVDKLFRREDVAEFLSQADALILPLADFGRPYVGMSSKLYEYQAVGKPIICCGEGQPVEYLKETKSGISMQSGDYKALAQAVVSLIENPDCARIMGENGRRYVEKMLSIESIGKQILEILKTSIK
jgi:glycosyltransferase involved in cell wall biosynthesis